MPKKIYYFFKKMEYVNVLPKLESHLNIVVIGLQKTDKSTLVNTFVYTENCIPRENFRITDINLKVKRVQSGELTIILKIWEISADNDRLSNQVYFKDCKGIIYVIDMEQKDHEEIEKEHNILMNKANEYITEYNPDYISGSIPESIVCNRLTNDNSVTVMNLYNNKTDLNIIDPTDKSQVNLLFGNIINQILVIHSINEPTNNNNKDEDEKSEENSEDLNYDGLFG
jgi:hypothetical protein